MSIIELSVCVLTIYIFLCLVKFIKHKNQKPKSNVLFNNTITQSSYSQNNVNGLDGVFEVHITVDPKENFVKLMQFIQTHKKSMKIVYAVSTDKINQYMISYFTRRNDESEVIHAANKIADEMTINGISVLRVKVEGHGAKGTPMTDEDYVTFTDFITKKYNTINSNITKHVQNPYFEFHVKIGDNIKTLNFYETIQEDIKILPNVAISYNMCSKDRKPLLTIRIYDKGFVNAVNYKDYVIDKLKGLGYVFDDKIQQEFSVYDSNPKIDEGWLLWK